MCQTTSSPELFEQAIAAADEVLAKTYGVDVAKALDPLDDKDYLKIVRRLGAALRKANAGEEAAALRGALDILDVDWPNISSKQRSAVVAASADAFKPVPNKVIPVMQNRFEVSGKGTIKGSKVSVKEQFDVKVGTDFTSVDKQVAKKLGKQQTNFIRDEYGRRRVGFSRKAKKIVGDGLDKGLGRKEIAADLKKQLTTSTINRNRHYWELVSATFTSRSRTYGQLSSFDEAGFTRYTFEAVMDEVTSEVCRFMHGKSFEVASALKTYDNLDALQDPEDVKFAAPWVRATTDGKGNAVLAYKQPSGRQRTVAQIGSSGKGTQGQGDYSGALSEQSLANAGIQMPPLHGRCRSTILPDI